MELLVVIAIIALLLALLLPALDGARYQANTAACSANLRQISVGLNSYAADFNNWYPYDKESRPLRMFPYPADGLPYRSEGKPWVVIETGGWDIWTPMQPYYGNSGPDLFMCPHIQAEWMSANNKQNPAPSTNARIIPYSLFFNMSTRGSVIKPMRRLGERWLTRGLYFNVVASDVINGGTPRRANHLPLGASGQWSARANGDGAGMQFYGPGNANYLYADGGVRYYSKVPVDATSNWIRLVSGDAASALIPNDHATTTE